MRIWGNEYNRMEFAGAFGDLGRLIPFVVGYITLNKMDPLGILCSLLQRGSLLNNLCGQPHL
ncbi:MAG TPA: hypothetical protein VKF36_18335 [Syntrophorhabdales bacterium]|nr:hypothetical protein [Syntrophorhabdales bacterium]